jgi:hypothetical protein
VLGGRLSIEDRPSRIGAHVNLGVDHGGAMPRMMRQHNGKRTGALRICHLIIPRTVLAVTATMGVYLRQSDESVPPPVARSLAHGLRRDVVPPDVKISVGDSDGGDCSLANHPHAVEVCNAFDVRRHLGECVEH